MFRARTHSVSMNRCIHQHLKNEIGSCINKLLANIVFNLIEMDSIKKQDIHQELINKLVNIFIYIVFIRNV